MRKTIQNKIRNLIISFVLFISIIASIAYAENSVYDKKGREIEQTVHPTAASTINPDTISDVSSSKYGTQKNNVISKGIIKDALNDMAHTTDLGYTKIRHTPSITNVEDNEFELITDTKTGRLKMKLKYSGVGVFEAKDGFFKVKGKTYYFDKDGIMVLGKAIDDIGNEYYFSYDTGELLEEIQK